MRLLWARMSVDPDGLHGVFLVFTLFLSSFQGGTRGGRRLKGRRDGLHRFFMAWRVNWQLLYYPGTPDAPHPPWVHQQRRGAQRRSTALWACALVVPLRALWPPEPLQGCRGAARQPAGVRGPLARFWAGSRGKRFLGPVSSAVDVSGGRGTQIEQCGRAPSR